MMDLKLELVVVPVSDVDRAKAFYEQAGFHADVDETVSEVQTLPWGKYVFFNDPDGNRWALQQSVAR